MCIRIRMQLYKNFQHILLGSSEKKLGLLDLGSFFLIDFYLVESIVSFAKKCSTTLKWLPYRHSSHFKWSKREFLCKKLRLSSNWEKSHFDLSKKSSFVTQNDKFFSHKTVRIVERKKWQIFSSFTFIIMLHFRLHMGQYFSYKQLQNCPPQPRTFFYFALNWFWHGYRIGI